MSNKSRKSSNKPKKNSGISRKSTTKTMGLNPSRQAQSTSPAMPWPTSSWIPWAGKANTRILAHSRSVILQRPPPWLSKTVRRHLPRAKSSASSRSNRQTCILSARKIANVPVPFPNNSPSDIAIRTTITRLLPAWYRRSMPRNLPVKKGKGKSVLRFGKATLSWRRNHTRKSAERRPKNHGPDPTLKRISKKMTKTSVDRMVWALMEWKAVKSQIQWFRAWFKNKLNYKIAQKIINQDKRMHWILPSAKVSRSTSARPSKNATFNQLTDPSLRTKSRNIFCKAGLWNLPNTESRPAKKKSPSISSSPWTVCKDSVLSLTTVRHPTSMRRKERYCRLFQAPKTLLIIFCTRTCWK